MTYQDNRGKAQVYEKKVSKKVSVRSILVIISMLIVAFSTSKTNPSPSHSSTPTPQLASKEPYVAKKTNPPPDHHSTPTRVPIPMPAPAPALVSALKPVANPLGVDPPATALICPGQQRNGFMDFVSSNNSTFVYQGSPITFYGYTSYPGSVGGPSAWRQTGFRQYLDHIMQMGADLGENLFRPTDYWDQNDPHPEQGSDNIWKNMDYLVCSAQRHGIFIEMDLSGFQKVLISHHLDSFDPNNWTDFLTAAGEHYRFQSSIAFYSIVGEPQVPQSIDAMNQLVNFYRVTTDTLHAADSQHLITAGGFNHMEDENAAIPWWQQIYALPNNNLAAFKTYSLADIQLMPTIAGFAKQIGKPALDEEFGMPQGFGDAAFAGGAGFNGITTGRAQFYQNVYSTGLGAGVGGFVFWDLGCGQGSGDFQVNPATPATWMVIKQYGPASSKTAPSDGDQSLCS